MAICDGDGNRLIRIYIPSLGDNNMNADEITAFAISSMQYLCKEMDEKKLKNNMKWESDYKLHSPEIKSKTVYILDASLSEKMVIGEIKNYYPFPIEVVSYEKWKNAILNKEDGIVYCIIVPFPMAGTILFMHYLIDSKNGIVYAVPKSSDKVTKKSLKQYNDAVLGKW